MLAKNLNTKYTFKHGFSLAEAMIVLTVVSIIMAISVPLVAKKAQIDTRTLFAHSTYSKTNGFNSSTSGGFGDTNAVGVGLKKAAAKLHVKDPTAKVKDRKVIFQAEGEDSTRAFKVYSDGSTNIIYAGGNACMPNYAAATASSDTGMTSQPGFLVATGQCVTIYSGSFNFKFCPDLIKTSGTDTTGFTGTYMGSVMVPVVQNTIYVAGETVKEMGSYNRYRTTKGAISNDSSRSLYFVPCIQ